MNQQIPLIDLKKQYQTIKSEVNSAILNVTSNCNFILGAELTSFEANFAKYCQTEYALGVANGTDALQLAFRVLEIGPGDEVIIPAMTFISTALGISLTGAKPVLVDVDSETGLIDPQQIEKAITPRTKCICPVHFYGQMCDMGPILKIAKEHQLYVVEDAAQAHGAEMNGKRAGGQGDLGCFSFYPGKNLGAYGDGGGITTNSLELKEKCHLLRNCGSNTKHYHDQVGTNSRLDTIHAAVLDIKLKYLDEWNQARRNHANSYNKILSQFEEIQVVKTNSEHSVYHLYVIRVKNRDQVLETLQKSGVGAGIHYPFAVHQLKAYQHLGYKNGDFPHSESLAAECLSLPMYAELPDYAFSTVEKVFKTIF
jgi:dTDP-4-amino-4,6-dideoxygalactose transaminase